MASVPESALSAFTNAKSGTVLGHRPGVMDAHHATFSSREGALPAVASLAPAHWWEVRVGDVLASQSGTRRLITGSVQSHGEPAFHCLVRSATGRIEQAFLKTSPATLEALKEVLRPEGQLLMPPPRTIGNAVLFNTTAFLGQGELGDDFLKAVWHAFAKITGNQSAAIAARIDPATRMIEHVTASPTLEEQASPLYLTIHCEMNSEKPLAITRIEIPASLGERVINEIKLAAVFSNTLRAA